MREIEFRGKDIRTGKWIYGGIRNIWSSADDRYVICPGNTYEADGFTDINEVEAESKTIGEYTGLKDKNDTMIYEGDIVRNGNGGLFIIGPLEQGSFSAIGTKGKQKDTVYHISALCSNTEVIGNIHDNPELLK